MLSRRVLLGSAVAAPGQSYTSQTQPQRIDFAGAAKSRPSDAIRAMVCGLASPARERRIMVMLTAYFDETGGLDGPVFFYAGFAASAAQWVLFSDAWQAECLKTPQTPDFHASAMNSVGAPCWGSKYDGVDTAKARRDARFLALSDIIKTHAALRIQTGMDTTNYTSLIKGKINKEYDSPLFLGFVAVINALYGWHRGNALSDKIELVFDKQSRIEKYAPYWYDYICWKIEPGARSVFSGAPAFRDDSAVLPLKAADMLAWHLRRHIDKNPRDKSEPLANLLDVPGVTADLPYPLLQEIQRGLSLAPPRRKRS